MKYLSGITVLLLSFGAALLFTQTVEAGEAAKDALNMNINIGNLSEPKQVAGIVKILLVMTSFTLLPGLLMVMTSFTPEPKIRYMRAGIVILERMGLKPS